jgi:4-hydroxybenzoate polyprenyltransferase
MSLLTSTRRRMAVGAAGQPTTLTPVRPSRARSWISMLRPRQWTKNGICLAGTVFSGRFSDPQAWLAACGVVAVFSAASSAVYILNDILDRDRDRLHPKKQHRAIASGAAPIGWAAALGLLLAAGAVAGASWLGPAALACLLLFLANNVAYSVRLKHLALFDVLCITFGFVLRLAAGTYAIGELPTTWIVLCSFFLAAFLGFAKRRAELHSLAAEDRQQRPVLGKYSLQYLDSLIGSSAIMAIMSYALFTTAAGRNPSLIVTLPVVYYAIMYYKRLVMVGNSGEEPDMILIKSRRIHFCIGLWLAMYLIVWKGDLHFLK